MSELSKPDGGPEFPSTMDDDLKEHLTIEWGLSVRDWFAEMAMAGFCVNGVTFIPDRAGTAYEYADEMLKEWAKAADKSEHEPKP